MRLAVSNLALPSEADEESWAALAKAGVGGIEVAPTRIAPWDALDAPRLEEFRARLARHGLGVPALQSIFFGVEGIALLEAGEAFAAMERQVAQVARIAAQLGAGVAVFGAPRQRARGGLSLAEALALGTERLHALARIAWRDGVAIALEPVPAAYGNDFLTGWREVLSVVRGVDHPGLRAHLDSACVMLAGDDIAEAISASAPWLVHYHAAEPKLAGFAAPVAPHAAAGAALRAVAYAGWVSVEMMPAEDAPLTALLQAARFTREVYG